jgi:CheY-like chemotaxis protein
MPAATDPNRNSDHPRHVLMVDDDDSRQEIVAEALEFERHKVGRARDGEEALEYVQSSTPHAIVSDLMVPRVVGWAFVERWRVDARCAGVPIAVVPASHNLRTAARRQAPHEVSAVAIDVLIGAVERLHRPCAP